MASSLIGSYFQSGTFAARPTAPSVTALASALYYATDNGHLYMWNGTTWATII